MHFSTYLFVGLVLLSKHSPSICSELTPKVEEDQLSRGLSKFSQAFYQQCAKSKSGNVIISPFSVAMALSLLSQASNGDTFDEIQSGLHLRINKTEIAHQFHEYYGSLKQNTGQNELNVANQIFVQEGYTLKADFKAQATTKFFSGVEHVDFLEADDAAKTINQFVNKLTKEKIKEIVQPIMFSDGKTRVLLLNTIYMKSQWAHKFDKQATFRDYFYVNETEKIVVDYMTMSQKMWSKNIDDLDSRALRLDYANSSLSFVIVLPNNQTGLQKLESQLVNYDLSQIIDDMSFKDCVVTIPKFRVDSEFNLNDILKKMGMILMFNDTYADLSGLFNVEDERFHVGDVIHKATMEINEEYSEASAATAIRVSRGKSFSRNGFFTAVHPFMYFVWDRGTRTPIFSGRIRNLPNSTSDHRFGRYGVRPSVSTNPADALIILNSYPNIDKLKFWGTENVTNS